MKDMNKLGEEQKTPLTGTSGEGSSKQPTLQLSETKVQNEGVKETNPRITNRPDIRTVTLEVGGLDSSTYSRSDALRY